MIDSQLVSRRGDNLDWHLKWGQSCGTEPLSVGSGAVSRSIVSELSHICGTSGQCLWKIGELLGVVGKNHVS